MPLGQIGCGRQNPPVQSAELQSTSLHDWEAVTAPLFPQKRRQYDPGVSRVDRLDRSVARSRVTLLDACIRVVGCLGCGGVPNVHKYLKLMIIRVNLQFLYRRPYQYKRKLSEWDIQFRCKQALQQFATV
ncbi:Hypothetical_protein [Hexamita inflata]|uniref:Hypothetical_protein n=1 Tax=Hexamita inflata TaxID=28002 RepID=A0AA86S1Z3_9EUKA|nr:Hypothetical protein HINF_LOCUS64240 [Hexamita inflata]